MGVGGYDMCECMSVHVLEWAGRAKVCMIVILKCVRKYVRVSIQCVLIVVMLVYETGCARVC